MRTISADLLTAQQSASNTPYIKLLFISADGETERDYTARCKGLEHTESQYRETASIVLVNSDRSVLDLIGYHVQIGYGYYTGETVAEPDGDGAGNEYAYAPCLWVRHQQEVSAEGELVVLLELEGIWGIIRDTVITMGAEPRHEVTYPGDTTIFSIVSQILNNVTVDRGGNVGIRVLYSSSQDDGIWATFQPPGFMINAEPFEYAADVIYALLGMCKMHLRSKPAIGAAPYPYLEARWPQDSDDVQTIYYDDEAPYFYEFSDRSNLVVPNMIKVFGNAVNGAGPGEAPVWTWTAAMIGATAINQSSIDSFMEVPVIELAPELTVEADIINRAESLVARVALEMQSARLVVRHDCRPELYDRIQVNDSRGY